MAELPTTGRVNVLGVGITPLGTKQVIQLIGSSIDKGAKGYICVTGVHGIMEAQRDPVLRSIINRSLVTTPDGKPTVWVGWLQGFREMTRVYGPDLMLDACAESVQSGYTHFLYGGNAGVAELLKLNLERRFPGLRVVGTYTPPFRPLNAAEQTELQELVARLKPDIFWVGLSTPKQERFMAEYLPQLATKVMIGVGAAFDVHTGGIKDAPDWVKRAGLQWFHRLCQEPRRLWKRYLYNNPRFVVRIASQLLRLRKYELA